MEEYAEFLAKLAAPGKEYLPRREANERGTDVPVRKANGRGKNVPVGKANGKCADASVQEKFPKRPDMLIVREKNLPEEAYLELFGRIWNLLETIKGPSALLIPHTHLPTAHKTGCPSLHLPLSLLKTYRREPAFSKNNNLLSEVKHIGVSIHSLEEAKTAEELGASYLTAGHIFATDCKKGIPPRGTAFLEEICQSVTIPVYAIGGIHPGNLHELQKTNAAGACMMSEYMKLEMDIAENDRQWYDDLEIYREMYEKGENW